MTTAEQNRLNPKDAGMAGALYLAIAVCGAFSIGYVPMQIVVERDAARTAQNLLSQVGLFRLGVLADSAVILFEIAITVVLFQMFRNISPRLAVIAIVSRFGMIVIMGVNLLLWTMAYVVVSQPIGLDQSGAPSLALVFIKAHSLGVFVWQIYFGAHLLALGAMVLRSRMVPRLLGWGLLVGALGYLIQGIVELTFTDSAALNILIIGLLTIVTISELSFGFWLLFRGSRSIRIQDALPSTKV